MAKPSPHHHRCSPPPKVVAITFGDHQRLPPKVEAAGEWRRFRQSEGEGKVKDNQVIHREIFIDPLYHLVSSHLVSYHLD